MDAYSYMHVGFAVVLLPFFIFLFPWLLGRIWVLMLCKQGGTGKEKKDERVNG